MSDTPLSKEPASVVVGFKPLSQRMDEMRTELGEHVLTACALLTPDEIDRCVWRAISQYHGEPQ